MLELRVRQVLAVRVRQIVPERGMTADAPTWGWLGGDLVERDGRRWRLVPAGSRGGECLGCAFRDAGEFSELPCPVRPPSGGLGPELVCSKSPMGVWVEVDQLGEDFRRVLNKKENDHERDGQVEGEVGGVGEGRRRGEGFGGED